MSTMSSFRSIENKNDVYRGKDWIKKFCESLREHAIKILNFFKNEIINKRAAGIIWKYKIGYICKEKFKNKYLKEKNIVKLEIIVIIQENIEVLPIAYVI